MARERRTLRVPDIGAEDAATGAELLRVLLSFSPFKNPQVEWLPADECLLARFDFLGTGDKDYDNLTLQLNLRSFVLPMLIGDKGPLVIHEVEILGVLKWESEFNSWKCEVELGPNDYVEFQLESAEQRKQDSCDEADVALPSAEMINRAREIAGDLSHFDRLWRAAASDGLLELYNLNWNDGPAIDSASFQQRLSLSCVALNLDGTTKIWLRQDDLFTDHIVTVELDARGHVNDVGIEG